MKKRRRSSPHLATRLTNALELSARRFEVSTRAIRRKQAPRESVNRSEKEKEREKERERERERERSLQGQNEILSSKTGDGERGGKVGRGVCVVKFSGLYFPRFVGETPRNFTRTIFFRQCRPCLRKRLVNEKTCVLSGKSEMQGEIHQRNP